MFSVECCVIMTDGVDVEREAGFHHRHQDGLGRESW